jgi:hypothetical protein
MFMPEFNIENGELQELSLGPPPPHYIFVFFFKFIICRMRPELMNAFCHWIIYVVNVIQNIQHYNKEWSQSGDGDPQVKYM